MKLPKLLELLNAKEHMLVRVRHRRDLNRRKPNAATQKWAARIANSILSGEEHPDYILDRATDVLKVDLSTMEYALIKTSTEYRQMLIDLYLSSDAKNDMLSRSTWHKMQIYNVLHLLPTAGIITTADLFYNSRRLITAISRGIYSGLSQPDIIKILYCSPHTAELVEKPTDVTKSVKLFNDEYGYVLKRKLECTYVSPDSQMLDVYVGDQLIKTVELTPEALDPTNKALYYYGKGRSREVQLMIIELVKENARICSLYSYNKAEVSPMQLCNTMLYVPKNDYCLRMRLNKLSIK